MMIFTENSFVKIDTMVLIEKIEQAGEWNTGALMVRAKETNFSGGYVRGEIGIVVYGSCGDDGCGDDSWAVVMTGGYHSQGFKTLSQLINSFISWGQLDFFHIEIKP
jgi:hypothetical protein